MGVVGGNVYKNDRSGQSQPRLCPRQLLRRRRLRHCIPLHQDFLCVGTILFKPCAHIITSLLAVDAMRVNYGCTNPIMHSESDERDFKEFWWTEYRNNQVFGGFILGLWNRIS